MLMSRLPVFFAPVTGKNFLFVMAQDPRPLLLPVDHKLPTNSLSPFLEVFF